MKTIIIFTELGELPVFFVVDGDYSHLDTEVIGKSGLASIGLEELIYDEHGNYKHEALDYFPSWVLVQTAIRGDSLCIISCGAVK